MGPSIGSAPRSATLGACASDVGGSSTTMRPICRVAFCATRSRICRCAPCVARRLAGMAVVGELRREDVVLLLGVVPGRVGGLVSGLDEPRPAYRHAPALPPLQEVIAHLCHA